MIARFFFGSIAIILVLSTLEAETHLWTSSPAPGDIRGAAMSDASTVFTWGPQGAHRWNLQTRVPSKVAAGDFSAGGCWTPSFGLVLENAHTLTSQTLGFIDSNVYLADCVQTSLFGHKGILLIHRNAQIRFYEPPETPGGRWPYREIYSIYTPSAQTGLLVEDIDGDGRPDLYCGNYWVQSPQESELPWRLFAIHPHYKQPLSSSFRLAKAFGGIVGTQREFRDHPVFSVFRKPEDLKQLWIEQPLAAKVRRPQALLAIGGGIVVGEDAGVDSKLLFLRSPEDPGRIVAKPGRGILDAFKLSAETMVIVLRNGLRAYSLRDQ